MSVHPDVVLAVRELLDGRTRDRAMKGADLARAASGMVGRLLVVRRVQEAIDNLRSQGMAICSLSSAGYWHGQTAEEVEASLAEAERRARGALRQRRLLRTRLAELRGQVRIGEGV